MTIRKLQQSISTSISDTDEIIVSASFYYDYKTDVITWHISTIDPVTGIELLYTTNENGDFMSALDYHNYYFMESYDASIRMDEKAFFRYRKNIIDQLKHEKYKNIWDRVHKELTFPPNR